MSGEPTEAGIETVMPPRWVTFDCFGTLVDWHTGFATVLAPILGERVAEVLAAYHRHERRLEAARPHLPYTEVLVRGLMDAARDIGIALSEAQARTLPESWRTLPVFGDVEDMLAGLRDLGCRLGVLTNCDDRLFEETHRSFRGRFDLVVTAERVRDYKPSLSHFRYFSRTTGVDHNAWVHVACSWYHDIMPAREFGISRIWLDRDQTGDDAAAATTRVTSAEEVLDAIRRR